MKNLIKTTDEFNIMSEGGKLLAEIRDYLLQKITVGVSGLYIDNLAKKMIVQYGGSPSFMTVNGYQWATCISINDGVVHGIPTKTSFKAGDVIGLDIGLIYKGYHTDTSWSIVINDTNQAYNAQKKEFLSVGRKALLKAIAQAKPGNHVGHISQAIQQTIESHSYGVVKNLVGHGIGKSLHESPQIPGVISRPVEKTPKLLSGMMMAIEVIYTQGDPEIVHQNDDGWTLVTADGSLSGLFEHTVGILEKGPVVLTQSDFLGKISTS